MWYHCQGGSYHALEMYFPLVARGLAAVAFPFAVAGDPEPGAASEVGGSMAER